MEDNVIYIEEYKKRLGELGLVVFVFSIVNMIVFLKEIIYCIFDEVFEEYLVDL